MISTTVYVSTLREELGTDELNELLAESRAHNARTGISGMLTVRGRDVMQVLEDDTRDVRDLYARISRDSRHSNVVTVWTSTHQDRRFPNWSMGFDNLQTEPPTEAAEEWPEPDVAVLTDSGAPSSDASGYVARRGRVLRRALFSGDRSLTTLAIILDGHRPEMILKPGGATRVRCAECRVFPGTDTDMYPCPTPKNATWALESALPPARN